MESTIKNFQNIKNLIRSDFHAQKSIQDRLIGPIISRTVDLNVGWN